MCALGPRLSDQLSFHKVTATTLLGGCFNGSETVEVMSTNSMRDEYLPVVHESYTFPTHKEFISKPCGQAGKGSLRYLVDQGIQR